MSENNPATTIDDAAIARLPEMLFRNEADALYGNAITALAQNLAFEREMAELSDKMVLEVSTMFDEDNIELDFSEDSLEQLDKLVSQVWGEAPPDDADALDAIVANWGAYLGAAIVHNVGGQWQFRQDLEHASVYFPRTGMEVFPLHKVRKRFRLGEAESMASFYEAIVEELTAS